MPHFTIIHLDQSQLAGAFALVRLAAPVVEPEGWHRFAESLEAEGGILGAISPDGTLHGVAAYRRDHDLVHGSTLRADPFVTCELSPAEPVRAALVEALERLAAAHGCSALALACRGHRPQESRTANGWLALGFEPESIGIVKTLSAKRFARPRRTACG